MADNYLELVAKLLNQAENTDNENEAQTFMDRAQQLATSHSIDLAKARHLTVAKEKTMPIVRGIRIGMKGDKGLASLVALFSGIAHANDIKISIARNKTYVYAHGYEEDIEVAEAMFASLQVQQARFVAEYRVEGSWRAEEVWQPARYITRYLDYEGKPCKKRDSWDEEQDYIPGCYKQISWLTARINFQEGFANRIAHRLHVVYLEERVSRVEAEAEAHDSTDPGTALVLAEKEKSVEALYYERNPHFLKRHRKYDDGSKNRLSSWRARHAGQAAGDRASLSGGTPIGGVKGAIGA